MEIKEAIEILNELNIMTLWDGDSICNSEFAEALKMAISALEKQKVKKPITNADRIRSMTDEEIEDWYWWMHKEMMNCTESHVFVHDWLKQEANNG